MGREIGVTLLRLWVLRHGVIPASRGGKAKTFVQSLAIGLYLLPLPDLVAVGVLRWTVLAVAIVLTVVTGLDYVLRGAAPARRPQPRRRPSRPEACSP